MAGIDNSVLNGIGLRIDPYNAVALLIMQDEADGLALYNVTADPEGSIAANPGSMAMDRTNGELYFKVSGTGNTGWEQIQSGATVATTYDCDTGSATPAANTLTLTGGTPVAGTSPVSTSGSGSTVTTNVQISQALAATDATKIGLCNFDSASFAVDANGFVTTSGTGLANTITGDSGGALSPTAGNWNILGGTGCSTSGSGSTLTVNVEGGGFEWVNVTGTSDDLEANTGFSANNAALVTLTLPATCTIGDRIIVTGVGAGGWLIAQNAGQTIHLGNTSTTTGVGGSLASTNQRDSLTLVCVATDTDFNVLSVVGNITVV